MPPLPPTEVSIYSTSLGIGYLQYEIAPLPPENDPPHRYAILLWQQPASFTPPTDLSTPGQPITQFDLNNYVTVSFIAHLLLNKTNLHYQYSPADWAP